MAIFAIPFKYLRKITFFIKGKIFRRSLPSTDACSDAAKCQPPAKKSKRKVAENPKEVGGNSSELSSDTPNSDKPKVQTINASYKAFSNDAEQWVVVGASGQGNGHISMHMPCQDSSGYKYLGKGWGIAVASDGAGSAKNSQVGSAITVQRVLVHFENLISKEGWVNDNILPDEIQWLKSSYRCLKQVHDDIEYFAKQKNVNFSSLSSTVIVVIHSPHGVLVCYVGDGRAGYMSTDGQWHSLIIPHKGEEANQTIFLTSDFWNIPYYEMSGVLCPEARVISGNVAAFVLMSDGCENTSWRCNLFDKNTHKYYDPNLPHKPFFDSIIKTLHSFRDNKIPDDARSNKWAAFIAEGNDSFVRESDDKTMIVGYLYK